jgi:3-hydroxymyristoyl/3-hydroxydecanoyl-(acyl carrier protein) dehydratase
MQETWLNFVEFINTTYSLTGHFSVPSNSPWFSGHFPTEPILPGIALISMVNETLKTCNQYNEEQLFIKELKRVRFRKIVQPDENLTVVITRDKGNEGTQWDFETKSADIIVCSGTVVLQKEKSSQNNQIISRPIFQLCREYPGIIIEDLIPHRDRMKLIDKVIEISDDLCIATAKARNTWPLYDGSVIHPIITIELIAQTVALSVGWNRRNETKIGGNGVLVGIRNAQFSSSNIEEGSRLSVSITKLFSHDNYGVFEGTVQNDKELNGKAQIQVFRP